ncbi:MAG: ATP-binding protein [Sulfurimonadaceae bacterium]|nr:ATP-binding protein [Sulfurimonadaceae bacterium]
MFNVFNMLYEKSRKFYTIVFIIASLIIVTGLVIVLTLVNRHLEAHKEDLVSTSKIHFEHIVNSRAWNAHYGGVFVYKKEGIEPNPYLVNNHVYDENGKMLVKINPAWMTRMLSEIEHTEDFDFRITSLNPINPINTPSDFEIRALSYLEENRDQRFFHEMDYDTDTFRFLGALEVTQACMKCHAKQGYQVGDIRGGISVSLNMADHLATVNFMQIVKVLALLAALAIIILIAFTIFYLYRYQAFLTNQRQYLEYTVAQRTEALEKAKEEAEQANRLKNEFLSNVTHELRTPLNTILSMSQLAIKECDQPHNDCLTAIHHSGQILHVLVNNIIDFSKADAGLLEPESKVFKLKGLMENVEHFVAYKAHTKGISTKLEVDPEIPGILLGDPQRLQQVLNQLADNAVKYTAEGGVKISASLVEKSDHLVKVKFTIKDTGIGISEADQQKLFKDVVQLNGSHKRDHGGIGLGLIFCKRLLEILGGTIELQSTPGKGTAVMVEMTFDISTIENNITEERIREKVKQSECDAVGYAELPENIVKLLNIVRDDIESDYAASMETFNEVREMAHQSCISSAVELIAQKIDLFDVDAAKKLIDALLDELDRKD